jgi:hypothetical protein
VTLIGEHDNGSSGRARHTKYSWLSTARGAMMHLVRQFRRDCVALSLVQALNAMAGYAFAWASLFRLGFRYPH